MRHSDIIQVGVRTYRKNPEVDRFQIPLEELGTLKMIEVPPQSHLEVLGLPIPEGNIECEMWIVNAGHPGSDEGLSVYGGASIPVTPENAATAIARLQRAFPGQYQYGSLLNPQFRVEDFMDRGLKANVFLNMEFCGRGNTTVRDAIRPFVSGFRLLAGPDAQVFVCHASEDKPFVRTLSRFMADQGAGVWVDEREIRVGDSIVEKIDHGIETATHLVVVLSKHSIARPWVTKELSAALMRQLSTRKIAVLPVRIDDSPVPVLLADIKYADCRESIDRGFTELLTAILG